MSVDVRINVLNKYVCLNLLLILRSRTPPSPHHHLVTLCSMQLWFTGFVWRRCHAVGCLLWGNSSFLRHAMHCIFVQLCRLITPYLLQVYVWVGSGANDIEKKESLNIAAVRFVSMCNRYVRYVKQMARCVVWCVSYTRLYQETWRDYVLHDVI